MMAAINERFTSSDIMSLTTQHPLYDLAESVSPDLTLADVISEADYHELANTQLGYSSAAGNPLLRGVIADQYNAVESDDVVVTHGGMHAIYLLGQVMGSGDIVMQQPSFPLTALAMQVNGRRINTFRSSFDDGYRIESSAVERALTSNTVLVCIESPQNPSGVVCSAETVSQILDAMSRVCPKAFLLLDETYRNAVYCDSPRMESLALTHPRMVVTSSLSKCHGAPGLRIGWAVTNDSMLRRQLVRGKFQSTLANATIDELLATRVLEQASVHLGKRQRDLARGRALVEDWIGTHPRHLQWVKPDAGALCCVRLLGNTDDRTHCTEEQSFDFYQALEKRSVRVAPGHWFHESSDIFRLGFGYLSLEKTKAALSEISNVLADS